jgi:hypothetical protein
LITGCKNEEGTHQSTNDYRTSQGFGGRILCKQQSIRANTRERYSAELKTRTIFSLGESVINEKWQKLVKKEKPATI